MEPRKSLAAALTKDRSAKKRIDHIKIDGARVIFRNFAGAKTAFNAEGSRNFCVVIDDLDQVKKLLDDGWNIRLREPREEGDEPLHYIQVAVSFAVVPPRVVRITKRSREDLEEGTVKVLDFDKFEHVDLVISPYEWEVNGKSGVKAYLEEMWVTVKESEFADKYE
jgi:hypothetical protein